MDPTEFLSVRLNQLYEYWRASFPDNDLLPLRSSLDPVDIPKLLSMLLLTEIHQDNNQEPRVLLKLIGTDMVTQWGSDVTGQYLDQVLEGEFFDYIESHYQLVVRRKEPLYTHYLLRWEDGHISNSSRIYLPYCVGENQNEVSHVLVGQHIRHDTQVLMKPLSSGAKKLTVIEIDKQFF